MQSMRHIVKYRFLPTWQDTIPNPHERYAKYPKAIVSANSAGQPRLPKFFRSTPYEVHMRELL
jgi:hypothetical protein